MWKLGRVEHGEQFLTFDDSTLESNIFFPNGHYYTHEGSVYLFKV